MREQEHAPRRDEPKPRRFPAGVLALGVVLLLVAAAATWIVTSAVDDNVQELGASIAAIASDPDRFYGERVAVEGAMLFEPGAA